MRKMWFYFVLGLGLAVICGGAREIYSQQTASDEYLLTVRSYNLAKQVKDYLVEREFAPIYVEYLPDEYRHKLQTMLDIQGRLVERENPISVVPGAIVSLERNEIGGFNISLAMPSANGNFEWLNIR